MKRGVLVCFSALLALLVGGAGADAGDIDPTGVWQVTRSSSKTVGMCPMGGDGGGELTIEKTPGGLTLTYGAGMTCNPAEVCRLTGSKTGGTDAFRFSTTVPVDHEGGRVTNTLDLEFASATAAAGSGSSKYLHPEGFSCTWTFDVTLTR